MEPTDQHADVGTNEIQLLDLPNEILLEIFCNLGDHTLLKKVGVCKRFKIIAEASFAKKYNGECDKAFYSLKVSGESSDDEQKQYLQIFRKFGGNLKAIDIGFRGDVVERDHWLITLIQRYCRAATKVKINNGKGVDLHSIICGMPNPSQLHLIGIEVLNRNWTQYTYPELVQFSAKFCEVDHDALILFFDNNSQLENLDLSIDHRPNYLLLRTVSDKLKQLKCCTLMGNNFSFTETESILKMESLKSLTVTADRISCRSLPTYVRSLKNIENLTIYVRNHEYELQVRDINLLCSFKMLKSLQLVGRYELSFELLRILMMHLRNLVSCSFGYAESLCDSADDLLNVASVCRKLSQLELIFYFYLPSLDYNFCTRFADIMEINGNNSEMLLLLRNKNETMFFTRHEARSIDKYGLHRILYWNGYDAQFKSSNMNFLALDKNVVMKIASFLDGNSLLSLAQTCMRGQRFVTEYLMENRVFHCAFTLNQRTNENVFMVLGENISRIHVRLYYLVYEDEDNENVRLKAKFIKCVNQYCGTSLTEMEITHPVQSKTKLYWPRLRKLKFSYIDIQKLRQFHCPELTHLNIERFYNDESVGSDDWPSTSFPNLNDLTFECYNESAESFLNRLNARICCQMKSLTIAGSFENNESRCWFKLTNSIARFERLVGLH